MALYTKRQFAELCGIFGKSQHAYISMNIKRGSIYPTGKMIDGSHIVNAAFIQSQKMLNETRLQKQKINVGAKNPEKLESADAIKKENNSKPVKISNDADYARSKEFEEKQIQEQQMRALEIEKKQEEIKLLKIKFDKANGLVVPTDLVQSTFSIHVKSLQNAFYNASEDLITRVSVKNNLSREWLADLRGQLIDIMNNAADEALSDGAKSIRNIVEEYKEVRGQGERK